MGARRRGTPVCALVFQALRATWSLQPQLGKLSAKLGRCDNLS
jgi:hypothetical protein